MARVLVESSSSRGRCPSSPNKRHSSSPRRRGPSAFASQTEAYGQAACDLPDSQPAKWNALHGCHQRPDRPHLATSQPCRTGLYSPPWRRAIGVVRVAWNHGRGHYAGKATEEMEQGMEDPVDRGIQSLLARPLGRNHRSKLRHWVPACAGMTDIACAGMNDTGFAADGKAEHRIDH